MANPDRKRKKILLICGITGAVYFGFQYLLPLVVPFLLAYGTALWMRPSVRYLERRLCWRIRGKTYRVPVTVIGAAELVVLFTISAAAVYFVLKKLLEQINGFLAVFPRWLLRLDQALTEICKNMERGLGLKNHSLVNLAADMVAELGNAVRQSTMPVLMSNSVAVIKVMAGVLIFIVLFFVSTLLFFHEMEEIREKKSNSLFHKEFAMIGRRLAAAGNAWLKTQILILMITSALCAAGLLLLGNPYSLLLGIGIGVLDAFPFLGAAVVLVPWGVWELFQREWMKGIILLGVYVISYFVRQFMETRIMGNKMGLSALETLISMYVGLQLFGFAGVLLGPIGLLVIEDLLALYGTEERH